MVVGKVSGGGADREEVKVGKEAFGPFAGGEVIGNATISTAADGVGSRWFLSSVWWRSR